MRFILFLAAGLALATNSMAQQVNIEPADKQVNNIPRKGLKATIELDKKFVEKYWERTLKEQSGKYQLSKGTYTVDNAKMPTVSASPVKIISTVEAGKNATEVWYALDLGSEYVTAEGDAKAYAAAQKFLQDFARYVHREDINLQIADAERVLSRTQGEHDRTVKGAADLQNKISKNKANRAMLEQQLTQNADELLKLEQEVITNQKAQAAAQAEVENMKKALEVVKAKASAVTLE